MAARPTPIDADLETLIAGGRLVEAVDRLAAAARASDDVDLLERLIDLRAAAAAAGTPAEGRTPWPPPYTDPFPGQRGQVPEIPAAALTSDVLGGAVAHHGALVVRGVASPAQVQAAVSTIDSVHALGDGAPSGATVDPRLFRPLETPRSKDRVLRQVVRDQGGTWLADSPAGAALLLDALGDMGITACIEGHLGERPFFSLQKSTMRRSLPVFNLVAWHQDGSFLDPEVRTMNVWLALSACGGPDSDRPALEVMPRRIDEILPVDGVMSPHSVSYDLVAELAADTPTTIPVFEPGDAILFDQHFLHRTHLSEQMTSIRYALECWFFAPSHQSPNYLPLLA
jgi:hypothetical protein